MGRILAIDYGQKRVGIAVSDPLQIIATGLKTVMAKDIFLFLDQYLLQEKVDIIIVGDAKQMNNVQSESMKYINPFFKKLKQKYQQATCVLYDERFTSKMALQAMIMAGTKKSDRQNKATIDMVSATILLQDFMNFLKNNPL